MFWAPSFPRMGSPTREFSEGDVSGLCPLILIQQQRLGTEVPLGSQGAVLSFRTTLRRGGWETETAGSVAGPPWSSAQVLCGEAGCWQPPVFWGGCSLLPAYPTLPSPPRPPTLSPPTEGCPGGKAAGGLLPTHPQDSFAPQTPQKASTSHQQRQTFAHPPGACGGHYQNS